MQGRRHPCPGHGAGSPEKKRGIRDDPVSGTLPTCPKPLRVQGGSHFAEGFGGEQPPVRNSRYPQAMGNDARAVVEASAAVVLSLVLQR